jgi:hypothetical protein
MFKVITTMRHDISRLDVRLLLAFEALADEANVTRAANRIGMTQQRLSGQLARLRRVSLQIPIDVGQGFRFEAGRLGSISAGQPREN